MDLVDELLEPLACILQTQGHPRELKQAKRHYHSCCRYILSHHLDLVISVSQIQLAENLAALKAVREVLYIGHRLFIWLCDQIQAAVVPHGLHVPFAFLTISSGEDPALLEWWIMPSASIFVKSPLAARCFVASWQQNLAVTDRPFISKKCSTTCLIGATPCLCLWQWDSRWKNNTVGGCGHCCQSPPYVTVVLSRKVVHVLCIHQLSAVQVHCQLVILDEISSQNSKVHHSQQKCPLKKTAAQL